MAGYRTIKQTTCIKLLKASALSRDTFCGRRGFLLLAAGEAHAYDTRMLEFLRQLALGIEQ
jgi:hypothetical protein